jgi:PAS domain S-box-containing protein
MLSKSDLSVNILSAIGDSYALLEGSKNLKSAISKILPILGKASSVDRVYVFRNYYNSDGVFCLSHLSEWCREGIVAQMENDNLIEVPWSLFPELEILLRKNKVQNQLVKDSSNETFVEVMTQQEIVAYLFIPILVHNEFWGFIGFDNCTREELFTLEQVSALHAFATTLGNLIFAKRSYMKALKSQKKYKQIISNIQDVVFKLDHEKNITYLNGAWLNMTGRKIVDCVGRPLSDFFIKDGKQKFNNRIELLESKGKRNFSLRTAFKKDSGAEYHICVNLKKIKKDSITEFFGTINDIHQSQINFELLKESESNFKALFDTVEDVLYLLDANTGQVLVISDRVDRFGFNKAEFLADPMFWKNQILAEDLPEVERSFSEFVENKLSIFEKEYRIHKSDGSIAWVFDRATLEFDLRKSSYRILGKITDITDQKNKELQLEQTEDRFRIVTENLPFPFILCRANDLSLLYYNFAFYESFPLRKGGMPGFGKPWIDKLVSNEAKDDLVNFFQSNENFSNLEVLLDTNEGTQWYSLNSQVIPYKMEFARAIVFYNINKRKLSELEFIRMNDVIQAINQTQMDFSMDDEIQDTFHMLLESLIGFTDSSFGFLGEVLYDEKCQPYLKSNAITNISWNEETEEYYQKNFRVGMEFRSLDSLFGWVLVNKEVLISNEVAQDSKRSPLGTPMGHPELNRFLGIPIFKGDRFVGMVGLANKEKPYTQEDVDFLKPFLSSYANLIDSLNLNRAKREAELRQKHSESLYRLLSENIDDVVTLHDLELKTVYASPSLEKVTGFKPDQFIGKDFFGFFNFKPNEGSDFTQFPRFIIPLNHGVSRKEIRLEMLWKPIYTENGELTSYLAASRDVTERELVLEELKRNLDKEIELNQLKSKFISMTSHELRTPLATIQSAADLMEIISDGLEQGKTHGSLMKQIRKIHVQISRLTQIISDVMLFEKNIEGKLNYDQSEVDLRGLIIQLVFNQFALTENEPKIQLELGEEPIILRSDPGLLFHVLRNLIENALKYTPEGASRPILKIFPKLKSIEIQVVDFGIGIPEEEAKYVFDTFFRASNVKNIKGTGLGLSIVSDLVKKLGGKLTFASIENQGSTFTVNLPYERKYTVD